MGSLLGTSDRDLKELGEENTIQGVLQDFGNELQDELRNNLEILQHTDTNALWQSIQFRVKFLGQFFVFELGYEDYGDFLDQGVEGVGGAKANGQAWRKHNVNSPFKFKNKKPPIKTLEGWAYRKRLNPFALSESIFHRGIENTNWYSSVVTDARIEKLNEDLARAGATELTISLKNAFEQNALSGIGR